MAAPIEEIAETEETAETAETTEPVAVAEPIDFEPVTFSKKEMDQYIQGFQGYEGGPAKVLAETLASEFEIDNPAGVWSRLRKRCGSTEPYTTGRAARFGGKSRNAFCYGYTGGYGVL